MTSSPPGTDLQALLSAQRAAFLRDGPPGVTARRRDLGRLRRAIVARRSAFVTAIGDDFGHRPRQETELLDLVSTVGGIGYMEKHLGRWMRPERRGVSLQFRPASNRIEYQPLGVVGIISPWNYPAALALMPLATALAAGNRVMLKPSEVSWRTTALLADLVRELFPPEQVTVVEGDATIGAQFAGLAFDHLLFTGGTGVGREILRAASANLVPVTLELGGKSPVIVDRAADLTLAARRIAFGKLANAGQTCVAPDYALVAAEQVDTFVARYGEAVATLYPDTGANSDFSSIITQRHYDRLVALIYDARAHGARVVEYGAETPLAQRVHPRIFLPHLVLGVAPPMRLATEEIFGPILPVIPYTGIDQAIEYINARPRPLSLYFFGPEGASRQQVLTRTTSGGVGINDTLLQYGQEDLPFGGIGESGMGAYHGEEGFKRLSHGRAIFVQAGLTAFDVVRPPFGRWFERAMGWLLR